MWIRAISPSTHPSIHPSVHPFPPTRLTRPSTQALQWLSWIADGTLDRKVRRSSFALLDTETAAAAAAPSPTPSPAATRNGSNGSNDGLRRRVTATAAPVIDAADAGDAAPPRPGAPRGAAVQKQKQRGGFDPFLFPASRPMHRHAQPSLLSHGEPGGMIRAPRPKPWF